MKLAIRCLVLVAGFLFLFGGQLSAAEEGPMRVAIAGMVHQHVQLFFMNYLQRKDIQVVGISEPNRAIFDRYAAKFNLDASLYHADLEEMLLTTKPQAVLIFTTTYDHLKIVEICAKHHISVMMEKPLALSVEDAYAIERTANQANIQVLVNYETEWYASNHAAYDLAHSGAIGDVRKVVVHDGHRGPTAIGTAPEFLAWLTDPKLNGAGALFDFGCYGADLMTWLMDGQKPLTVTAVTQQIKPDVYPLVDDEATIVLTYPKAQAIIQASWNWPFDRKDMEVYGQTGYVFTVAGNNVRVRTAKEKEDQMSEAKKIAPPYDDSMSYLRAVVLDGAKADEMSSLATNVIVTEILVAARESAANGKTVKLQ